MPLVIHNQKIVTNHLGEVDTQQQACEPGWDQGISTPLCSICLDPYIGQRLVQCSVCKGIVHRLPHVS